MTSSRWVGATVIAFLFVLVGIGFWRDHSEAAFKMAIGVAIYFGLLIVFPAAARLWLCLGGAFVGAAILEAIVLSVIGIFQDGWNVFGLMIWSTPVTAIAGGVTGFWLVHRWTQPPESQGRLAD